MSVISIGPDPAHPRGGFALLSLPEDRLPGETAQVAVFDNYSERYLGESGWQPVKVMFGPYTLVREAGRASLIIGPEIVNQIEEYANVKLIVGDTETDISWPDDVVPAPGAARIGGIMSASGGEQKAKGTLTAQLPVDEPDPVAPPELLQETEAGLDAVAPEIESQRGSSGIWIGLLVLLLLAAGLAYWFFDMDGPTVKADEPCAPAALGALADFAAQTEALRACGDKASADTALGLVERAAAAGDAEALDLFGTIYDGAMTAPVIEEEIGLTFGDVPATAAEYYARAVDAGSGDARDKLAVLCERMATMTDTLVRGAVSDYCDQ